MCWQIKQLYRWSPTGKPVPARRSAFRHAGVVPQNPTHLRHLLAEQVLWQARGFGGSSAGERNPPKHGRSIAGRIPIQSSAFLHSQGHACTPKCVTARRRGLLRRRMNHIKEKIMDIKLRAFIPTTRGNIIPNKTEITTRPQSSASREASLSGSTRGL